MCEDGMCEVGQNPIRGENGDINHFVEEGCGNKKNKKKYDGGKWISKDRMKQILQRADDERQHSKALQDRYTEKEDPEWFAFVTHEMHKSVLRDFGYADADLEDVVDELYTARFNYRFDDDMQKFFRTLTHVKFDLTGDGPLQIGEEIPNAKDIVLHELDSDATVTLGDKIESNRTSGKALVVFAGSWT